MRRRSFGLLLALLGASCALAAADGCTIINGLVVESDAATDGPNGNTEGGDALPGDGCDHLRPPPLPNVPDTADDITMVVVATQILLSTDPGTDPVGYDLDETCSGTAGMKETCIGQNEHLDVGGRGVDNNAGDLFGTLKARTKTDLEARVNTGIVAGKNSLLLRISNYNGKLDDPSVAISLYASPGLFDASTGESSPPRFDETEMWSLDQSQFSAISPDLPIATTKGYVSNGIVVGFISTTIALSSSFSIALNNGILTAQIDLKGPKPTITSAIAAGRWAARDMLRVVARQRTSDGGKVLCEDGNTYLAAKLLICGQLDIMADKANDKKGLACDGTSASLRFLMRPASLGPHRTEPKDEPCPGFPADDCGDGG